MRLNKTTNQFNKYGNSIYTWKFTACISWNFSVKHTVQYKLKQFNTFNKQGCIEMIKSDIIDIWVTDE